MAHVAFLVHMHVPCMRKHTLSAHALDRGIGPCTAECMPRRARGLSMLVWLQARASGATLTRARMRHAGCEALNLTPGFRIVPQLDYATSGVLCIALSKKAAGVASGLFADRLASKLYLALVHGHVAWEELVATEGVGEDASDARGFRMALETWTGCAKPLPARTAMHVVARGYLDGRPVTKLLMRPSSGRCRSVG